MRDFGLNSRWCYASAHYGRHHPYQSAQPAPTRLWPPAKVTAMSPSGRICASSDPKAGGKIDGIDAQGRLKVERADGKIFLFDVITEKTTED